MGALVIHVHINYPAFYARRVCPVDVRRDESVGKTPGSCGS